MNDQIGSGWNLPPGCDGGVDASDDVLHRCPKCGNEWFVNMYHEMGGWFYNYEDEAYCSCCETEGIKVNV